MPPGYLKNADIARRYNVSTATVSRWFRLAQENKYDIELIQESDKVYATDNEHNHEVFTQLTNQGIKYKTAEILNSVEPGKDFYTNFTDEEVYKIYQDLTNKRIDHNLTFHGIGAKEWDDYITKGLSTKKYTIAVTVQELLNESMSVLVRHLKDSGRSLNIVDTSPTDYPLSNTLIEQLVQNNIPLNGYYLVNSSQEMLNIVEKSIGIKDSLKINPYKHNLSLQPMRSILLDLYNQHPDSINLVINLGNELGNFDTPYSGLEGIVKSILPEDLFLFTYGTGKFNVNTHRKYLRRDRFFRTLQHEWILKSLGCDVEACEVVVETTDTEKYIYMIMDKEYQISLKINNRTYTAPLRQGEKVEILRYHLRSLPSIMDEINQHNPQLGLRYFNSSPDSTTLDALFLLGKN